MKNDFTIRLEKENEHRAVENLIRESFWNVYRPGCYEHYVIHVLRDDPAFVKELDFVMEQDGRLIGQNMFMRAVIQADDERNVDVLAMGPICITPELQRAGYGKALLDHSLEKATGLGFGAVLFEGNIDFYGKSGFDYAKKFGIRYNDLPEDADTFFFLCKELIAGYLDNVTGVYDPIKPDEKEEKIIDLLRSEPGITRAKMAKALGCSESTVKRAIQAMVSKNMIRRIGSNKKGEWIIVE